MCRSLAVEFLNTVAEVEYVLASTKTEGGSDDHLALVRQVSKHFILNSLDKYFIRVSTLRTATLPP